MRADLSGVLYPFRPQPDLLAERPKLSLGVGVQMRPPATHYMATVGHISPQVHVVHVDGHDGRRKCSAMTTPAEINMPTMTMSVISSPFTGDPLLTLVTTCSLTW